MSLQVRAQDSSGSDELDVIDELDTDPPAPMVAPSSVAVSASETPVVIPRVYQILMPNKKQHEVTPSIAATGLTAVDNRVDDVQYANSVVQTGVRYVYGIGNNQSVGAELNHLTHVNRTSFASVETSQKKNGLGNPSVHYKGVVNMVGISLFGYVDYSFKIEKETFDTDKQVGNSAVGQNRINLSLGGYKAINPDYIFGGLIHYSKAEDGERAEQSGSGSQTFKLSKGDRMVTSIFLEVQNEWHPNVSLGFIKSFSTESTDEFDNKIYSMNTDSVSLSVSAQFQTDKNIFFIPEISYTNTFDNEYLKKYNAFNFYGGLRLLF